MKQFLLLIFLSLTFGTIAISQGPPSRVGDKGHKGEKVKAMKVAYLSSKLELTPEEAEKFWPIYNELHEKNRNLRKDFIDRQNIGIDMTEAQAQAVIASQIKMEEAQLALKKEYIEKLHTAVSYKKLIMLKQAEKEFKKELLHRAKGQRKHR